MKAHRLAWILSVAATVGATAGGAQAAVTTGQQAPALQVGQWVKGPAVTLAQGRGKNVFIIDFWATSCEPCRETIPEISTIQKRFADRGLIVVGVSDEDAAVIKRFADRMEMDYRVAADYERRTSLAYRPERGGLPHSFVVDKRGIVVWQGHPLDGMERVVELVVTDRFDAQVQAKKDALKQSIESAFEKDSIDAALRSIDDLIALDPQDPEPYRRKILLLEGLDRDRDADAVRQELARAFRTNPRVLSDLAWQYATADDLTKRDPDRAVDLARQAVDLTQEKDASALDVLARAWYAIGDIDRAMETQQKAVNVAVGADRDRAQVALEYYLKVRKARAARMARPPARSETKPF